MKKRMLSLMIPCVPLKRLLCCATFGFLVFILTGAAYGASTSFVGTGVCKGCHEKQYETFTTHSKMGASFKSIEIRKKGLTGEELKTCYECHTTGYGKAGGFKSEAETPELKHMGCESCHGPGGIHASSGNPKDIKRRVEKKDCESCHNKDRVAAFNYRPLIFGGAH